MHYHEAIAAIGQAASHIGKAVTRPQALNRLSGDAKRSAAARNICNNEVVQYRIIGPYTVELALADFTGIRGCGYMCGITVWRGDTCEYDLSECVALDGVTAKLESLK